VETDSTWKIHIEKTTDLGKTWVNIPLGSSDSLKVIQPSLLLYGNRRLQLVCRSNQNHIMYSWSFDEGNTWGPLEMLKLPNPNSGIDAVTLDNTQQLLVYNPEISGKEWFNNRGKLNVAVSIDGINWKDVVILENERNKEFSYPAVIQTKDGRIHITYTYDRKNIKHVVLAFKN
jgi:alpha-L-fucosidase